jgi:hypothetical protein
MAKALGVSRQTIDELLRERRAITPPMALRLFRLFANSPEFWLNAQHSTAGLYEPALFSLPDASFFEAFNNFSSKS